MIDLLAPSKKEVFTTTAVSAYPRPSPYVDLASLEAGGGGGVGGGSAAADGNGRPYSYRGELREDDEVERLSGGTEPATDDGLDDSVFGRAAQKVTRHDVTRQMNQTFDMKRRDATRRDTTRSETRRFLIMVNSH